MWGDGSYKLVLAPSTDTDPPTSPIWTVDNINIYNSLDWDGLTATIPQLNACDTSVKFTGNANYTVLLTDRGKTIACNNNTANVNVILPDPTVLENGYMIRIKKTSLSVYTVTVDAGVGYTIDGFYRYYDLIGANNCTWLLWDGTRWNIIQEGFRRNYKAIPQPVP